MIIFPAKIKLYHQLDIYRRSFPWFGFDVHFAIEVIDPGPDIGQADSRRSLRWAGVKTFSIDLDRNQDLIGGLGQL